MRFAIIICSLASLFFGCKNNGSNTAQTKNAKAEQLEAPEKILKEILVGAKRKPVRPDFQVLSMTNEGDELTVIFQYSGGCKEHDFNAHFSGGWLKSLPPQAILDFEHLNPDNDSCRRLMKDTVYFDMTPLRFSGSDKVVVKYPEGKGTQLMYEYGS